ncbi:MAG: AAA family ATPase [Anaerolineales bacterium]|nr:AAA family ATPase [Anaerolineales bacterium]
MTVRTPPPKPAAAALRTDFRLDLAFTTRAARDLLALLGEAGAVPPNGGPADGNARQPGEAEARDRAATALSKLLAPRSVYEVYLRNGGLSNDTEQVVEIRIASDSSAAPNVALLAQLGGKSLVLVGAEKEDRFSGDSQFLLFSVRAVPDIWGQKDAYSLAGRITFSAGGAARGEAGLPMRLLAAVSKLPEARAQRETVSRRLADWHRYLGLLERTAKARQFNVTYKAFRRAGAETILTFTLDPGREPIPWDKLKAALDEPLEVRERRGLTRSDPDAPPDEDDSGDWQLGVIVSLEPERGEVTLALDDDAARMLEHKSLALPKTAALIYKASGDLAQLRRLKFGLDLLEQGYSENPRLNEFLFNAAAAHLPDPAHAVTLDPAALLQPRLNAGQRAAVEGALNAPDLFLIQGPPGTGKTTVIAEICYQNALRGRRTLIASQSNLAVDNALSKLMPHPRLRALRRGRADRVEVEGAPFLEDRVVGTWLAQTAVGCERDLADRQDRVAKFEALLVNRPRVEALAVALQRDQAERPQHLAAIADLETQVTPLRQHAEHLGRTIARRREARTLLESLRTAVDNTAEVPDLPAIDRLPWHDHPALKDLTTRAGALETTLAAWEPQAVGLKPTTAGASDLGAAEPAEAAAPDAGELEATAPAGTQPTARVTIVTTLREAAAARQRAKTTQARLADLRGRLEALREVGLNWYAGRAQRERLTQEHAHLTQAEGSFAERRAALEAEQAALQAKVAELAAFDAAALPMADVLRAWAERLAQSETVAGGVLEPPAEFTSPLGREFWAAAGGPAQLHRLSALAHEVRTARQEAARLAGLALRLSELIETLQADQAPAAGAPPLQAAAGFIGRPRRKAAHSTGHWKHSALHSLVAFDARGGLHPASGAEAALPDLQARLERLRQRPAWLPGLLGAEPRRQQAVGLWLQRLRAAAQDFTQRRADLQAAARHKSARLAERVTATADPLRAALLAAAQTFGPQANERLSAAQGELLAVTEAQPTVAARLDAVEAELAQLAGAQTALEARLQTGRDALGEARRTRPFQNLLRQVGRRSADDWRAAYQTALGGLDEALKELETAMLQLDPLAALGALLTDLSADIARLEQNAEQARQSNHGVERDLAVARERLQAQDDRRRQDLDWWHGLLAALPDRLLPPALAQASPDTPEYVQALLAAAAAWDKELEQERAYLARAEKLVTDWVTRLRAANAQDGDDLRQIYIDNANVIGITCVQAGAYQFSRHGAASRNFDCVIVDEVSKATPPELLLPMLKGARVVLVGDHQQLPPMIGPETIRDLAADLQVPQGELEHLERSLFKELFEAAPPALRVMLTEQYRMHPHIMQAINQFYGGQLTCGLPDPDRLRAHGLSLPWLKPDQHILWINTPSEGNFVEQRVGTTYQNPGELDAILRLVKELDTAWAPRVAAGAPPKEVGVITFYAAQVRALKQRLIDRAGSFPHLRLRVGTVDRFQGMERPIIIVSLVRNNAAGQVGFARKPERVNVAFSRAQELLVIVGSRELFTERAQDGAATAIYGRVAEVVQAAGGLRRTGDVPHANQR